VVLRNRELRAADGWLQVERLGYVEGRSLYEYITTSPVGHYDPFGLEGATTTPATQPHDPATCVNCGVNDIENDRAIADDSNWVGELFGTTAPNCGDWANPSYGDIVIGMFAAGVELGYTTSEGWKTNSTNSAGPWTQMGAEKIKAAFAKYLSRPMPGDKDPRGFFLDDPKKDCPCGYFKSAFFVRPKLDDYHFHHYSCRKKVWTEKEGSKNPPEDVTGDPLQDSGNGYLVGVYCLKGKERHTPAEL